MLRRLGSSDGTRYIFLDQSPMPPRPLLVVLLVIGAVVLLGQIWPEGAPPFARAVNIVFVATTLAVFAALLRRK